MKYFLTILFFSIFGAFKMTYEDNNKYIGDYYDTLFSKYAKKGYVSVFEEFNYDFDSKFLDASEEERMEMTLALKHYSKKYNCQDIEMEAKLLSALAMPDTTPDNIASKLKVLQNLANDAATKKNPVLELRIMVSIFDFLYNTAQDYHRTFIQLKLVDEKLKNFTNEQYPGKGSVYYSFAELYYKFRDFDNAIYYLNKSFVKPKYFFERSNLQAWNTLGLYHLGNGNTDSALYCFNAILLSPDSVYKRDRHNAIAKKHIADIFFEDNQPDTALALLKQSLCVMEKGNNSYAFISSIYTAMGNIYLSKDMMKETKEMIDKSLCYNKKIQPKSSLYNYIDIYLLQNKYYSTLRDADAAFLYLDSIRLAYNDKENVFNGLTQLKAEQELYETERQLQSAKTRFRTILISIACCIVAVVVGGLAMVNYRYRKKIAAYKLLVKKSREWANTATPFIEKNIPTENISRGEIDDIDIEIMNKIECLIIDKELFKDPTISLDNLAQKLEFNRAMLSKVINKCAEQNFNSYINEYRVKEAVKLLSDEKNMDTVEVIGEKCGFANRVSFYRAFKKYTGLSPSEFKRNTNI